MPTLAKESMGAFEPKAMGVAAAGVVKAAAGAMPEKPEKAVDVFEPKAVGASEPKPKAVGASEPKPLAGATEGKYEEEVMLGASVAQADIAGMTIERA